MLRLSSLHDLATLTRAGRLPAGATEQRLELLELLVDRLAVLCPAPRPPAPERHTTQLDRKAIRH
ncbi:hypothetical protein [Streptomyces sp. NBC_00566]|uniref:hypothetical protein n=1 Tax=Streptomyces sp. NBC_00566 TaxID=2975778 RepID=UPI003FCE45C7